MSNSSTVYIVEPHNLLQALLEDSCEPARQLAFMSWADAESYVEEMIGRADLYGVYRDEDWCEDDVVAESHGWTDDAAWLLFRSGRTAKIATVTEVPLGA